MVFKKIREKETALRKEIRERTIGYVLAAFGLVASLAWNEAIKSFIDQFFPANKNSVLIKFVYAVAVTVVVVLVSIYLVKFIKKTEPENK